MLCANSTRGVIAGGEVIGKQYFLCYNCNTGNAQDFGDLTASQICCALHQLEEYFWLAGPGKLQYYGICYYFNNRKCTRLW